MKPRQEATLAFIRRLEQNSLTPTLREIGEHIAVPSTSAVKKVVDQLVESGHLERRAGKARGIRLASAPDLRHVTSGALREELARRGETLEALARPIAGGQRRASCAADTCGAQVERGHLFCRRHWFKLPSELRDGILAAFGRKDAARYQALVAEARDIADGCGGAL